MRLSVWGFIKFALLGVVSGCGADDSPMSSGGAGTSASSSAKAGHGAGSAAVGGAGGQALGPVGPPTFTAVYALVSAKCAGPTCHVAATIKPGAGLAMSDKASAYKALVGVNSTACRGEKRVVASNPDRSEFVHVLSRTKLGACMPPPMPEGFAKLPQNEIDTVIGWIKAGAPNN